MINTFVYADLNKEIYMKMPLGYQRNGVILYLQKALYGLRKSPLLWQHDFTNTLKKIGFQPVPHEPYCLTYNGIRIFFYIDDIVVAFSRQEA